MYIVRYETQGFVEKEKFQNKKQAEDFYYTTLIRLGEYLLDLKIYEI